MNDRVEDSLLEVINQKCLKSTSTRELFEELIAKLKYLRSDGVKRLDAISALNHIRERNNVPEEIDDAILEAMDVLHFWCHRSHYIWQRDE